ncbi:MAG: HD-GYP domain-containing protein [Candidatus Eisenbacteria bacterium]
MVNQLYVVLRSVRIYEPNNASLVNALSGLLAVVRASTGSWGSVTLETAGGCLYVNGIRLRVDVSGYASHRYIVDEMRKFDLRNITFTEGLKLEEARSFAYALGQLGAGQGSFERLAHLFDENKIESILISKGVPADESQEQADSNQAGEAAKKTFFSAIKIVKQIMNSASQFEAVKLRRAKRVVQGIVDSILNDESFMFGLATIKNHDEYTFNHSVNVCIYSVALGQRLGLSKSRLSQLGMAALFHDIGKVEISWDILNKPGGLNAQEWETVKSHTVHGVKLLSRLSRLDERSLHAIVVAYQHHLNMDLSGYPSLPVTRSLDLFSRVVRITDAFDAMTTVRVYRLVACAPHESVLFLLREAGRSFDPRLVKVFVSMVGIYPVGTVLELDTGETAVVVKPARDIADIARPLVKVIADRDGVQCGDDTISLAEMDKAGRYVRSVKRVVEGEEFGLNVPELLLGPLEVDTVVSDAPA